MEESASIFFPRKVQDYLSCHPWTKDEQKTAYALMLYPLFLQGKRTKAQIADMLGCSIKTLDSIYRKNGLPQVSQKVLTIEEIKRQIVPVLKRESITSAWLFGSYARGEATPSSDIDLRIDCKDSPSLHGLIRIAGFREELADRLGKEVDLITQIPLGDLSKGFRDNLMKEEILLYEHAG